MYDIGSKDPVAGSAACPRKNSSGVLKGIPILVAMPLNTSASSYRWNS
jgi:hypothetical protein